MANERAEYEEEDAEPGALPLPSTIVKLPDLEWALRSLFPFVVFVEILRLRGGGRPFCTVRLGPSCGVAFVPMGVANLSCGGVGLEAGR